MMQQIAALTIYQRVGKVLEMATYSHINLVTRESQSNSSCRGLWEVSTTYFSKQRQVLNQIVLLNNLPSWISQTSTQVFILSQIPLTPWMDNETKERVMRCICIFPRLRPGTRT